MPSVVDTHCHLDFPEFDHDRDQVLHAAQNAGVVKMVVPGVRASQWAALSEWCNRHAQLYCSVGLHPVFLDEHQAGDIKALREFVETQRPLAIGEIGLDFYIRSLDRERQVELLKSQLAIACEFELPVILHVRKAHDDMLRLLRQYPVTGGVAHAFNGTLDHARHYLERGFRLGFGGMLTYERSRKLRALARQLPLDALVLETDAPDMTGLLHQGGRNSPEYLPEYLDTLAEIRGLSAIEVAEATTQNASAVFAFE